MAQGISGSTSRRQVLVAGAALAATAAASPALAQATAADGPRVAIIAGTSSGFGRLMAESFARRGITVIATMRDAGGRNSGPAEELRGLAEGEDLPIHVVEIDVLDEGSVRAGIAEALRLAGHVDILVNNAGIVVPGPVGLQPVDAFAANIETNCHGSLRMFRALAPHMQDRGRVRSSRCRARLAVCWIRCCRVTAPPSLPSRPPATPSPSSRGNSGSTSRSSSPPAPIRHGCRQTASAPAALSWHRQNDEVSEM